MKFNYGLFIVLDIIVWAGLLVSLFAIEVLHLDPVVWFVLGAIFLCLIIVSHICLLTAFIKNRKRIAILKDQYIESIKPAQPLRFCPSDEELVKAHQEVRIVKVNQPKENIKKVTQEKTQDEELEAEGM